MGDDNDMSKMFSKQQYTSEHADWLNDIMTNNGGAVKLRLAQCTEDVKYLLLEGWISDVSFWECWPGKESEVMRIMTVHRPLSLAAVCGSCDVIQEFHAASMDMFQADKLGNNVIHTLIIHANKNQEQETMYLRMFNTIATLMSEEDFNRLLINANFAGVKPLELAAHFQTFRLMNAILTAPGLYKKKEVTCGTLSIDYFDITDYECDSRCRPFV